LQNISYLLITCILFVASAIVQAQSSEMTQLNQTDWPKKITIKDETYTIFQPQMERWNGYTIEAHAAVSYISKNEKDPIFGVISLKSTAKIDKQKRLVSFDNIVIKNAKFPSAPNKQEPLRKKFQLSVSELVQTISLDRLEAGVALLDAKNEGLEVPVKNKSPDILLSFTPSVLVYIDGEPVFRPVAITNYSRVLNTRVLLLKHKNGLHYLRIMDGWMVAKELNGEWKIVKNETKELDLAMKTTLEDQSADLLSESKDKQQAESKGGAKKENNKKGPVPIIKIATTATELIVIEGQPNFVAIPKTQLLYADNTTGHLFRHLEDQNYYVLVSGRWYRNKTMSGDWRYVSQKDLSKDFKKIPDSSPKENVKASVAGTNQAQEALIANSIPETAEVVRNEVSYKPTFDGKPQLVAIEGTKLSRVENSPDTIIKVSNHDYYALYNGVWFYAKKLEGKWQAADTIPTEIYSIPPSSPVHNVTYVRVYQSTPKVIVIGYTPGYYGTVVVNGVVVYGTGYYYSPWIGRYWYGHPMTYGWGSSITYSPWGGWSYTFGVGYAWGYWGSPWWGPYPFPYWGPYYGYNPYHHHHAHYYGGVVYGAGGGALAWGPGGWAGTTGNVYRQWGENSAITRTSGGYNAYTGNGWRNQVGVAYNSRTGSIAAGQRAAVGNVYTGDYAYGKRGVMTNQDKGIAVAGAKGTIGNSYSGNSVTGGRAKIINTQTGSSLNVGKVTGSEGSVVRVGDNVFGSKDGQVYRHSENKDWEKVNRNGDWSKVKDKTFQQNLNRQLKSRNQGGNRTSAFNRSRRSAESFKNTRRTKGRGKRR